MCVGALLAARLARGSAPEMTRVCPPPAACGAGAGALALAPPPPLCPIASFTCRNRFARSAAVCCGGCPPLVGPRGPFPYGCARPPSRPPRGSGPPLRPYPSCGIDRGSAGGLREREKNTRNRAHRRQSRVRRHRSSSSVGRSVGRDAFDPSRSRSNVRSLVRSRAERDARRDAVRATTVARARSCVARRRDVPSRHDARRCDAKGGGWAFTHSFVGARTERVDANARARTIERIARCVVVVDRSSSSSSGVNHAVGARARVEGDDASSIGDGDDSARGDDDDDDARVVAHDGDV